MKHRTAILWLADRLLVAALAAIIVLAVLASTGRLAPQGLTRADIDASIAAHAAEPLDCNSLVIERWMSPDGTEILDPQLVPLWQYVQSWPRANEGRMTNFTHAFEMDLHNGDATFHLTHEAIDDKEWTP